MSVVVEDNDDFSDDDMKNDQLKDKEWDNDTLGGWDDARPEILEQRGLESEESFKKKLGVGGSGHAVK